jgi:two-component system alkaline phosphatase synthesis response regulator PhoP
VNTVNTPKILIAEDEPHLREVLRFQLENAGYDVIEASDGEQAVEQAHQHQPDLLLLDVMMPHLDGYELTRALRSDPRYATIPIVMLTSKDARIDQLRGLDAGADAYMTKPADAREIVRQVEALLARAAASV